MKKLFLFVISSVMFLAFILVGCQKNIETSNIPINTTQSNIYTKEEVNSLLAQKVSKQDVLDMLGKCSVYYLSPNNNPKNYRSCNELCTAHDENCILYLFTDKNSNLSRLDSCQNPFWTRNLADQQLKKAAGIENNCVCCPY